MTDQEVYVQVQQAAVRLRIGQTTVRKLFDAGMLHGYRLPGSGHRRIFDDSIRTLYYDMYGHEEGEQV